MSREGRFIAFEGVEGAGKSTHARRVFQRLRSRGVPARLVREPGGTVAGERMRDVVLDPELRLSAEAELLLMLAARAEFVRAVVRPALERGEVVLADRYELSTFAYQGVARDLGLERVRELNAFATGGLRPDLTVLLSVEPATGLRRKSEKPDRLEREPADFFRRVARAYARLAASEPDVVVVDSTGGREEVARRIDAELAGRWPETFAS